ncbi:MAG: bifunctional 2-polyprenyl-6-hydroxyphenol methylase/3-demethylubiquinol 3-O-methyltransferase UbiG [Hyphomicrobiales bacterium]
MLVNPQNPPPGEAARSLDPAELDRFSKLAAEWWNPEGKFRVLHIFNPVRLAFIKEQATARFHRDPFERHPLAGLRLLDIGCGGGLLSEPMARLGAGVVGIDPVERNIATARVHADEVELAIDYRATTAEALIGAGEIFDIILNMEVIEHVADPAAFMSTCTGLLRPGGLMFVATINRTLKSFGLAIIGAEYVLGWLPRGTHQWEKFITPEEVRVWAADNALDVLAETGVAYSPFTGEWRRSRDMDVNYMMLLGTPSQR